MSTKLVGGDEVALDDFLVHQPGYYFFDKFAHALEECNGVEALGGGIVSFTQFWDNAHSGLFPALWVVTGLDAGVNQVGDPVWGDGPHPF